MWMGIHKSEKTHCCGDGQIPSEKKKLLLDGLSRGPRCTHTESRLTGSSEMKAIFFFCFFLRGYRKKLQSGAVARKRAAFGEVNRRRSATAAIGFKLPHGFVSVRPQLWSPSSHRGSAFSVPGTSGLVIGGRRRVHGKTYFGKARGNHSLPSPLAFSAVIVDPAILTLTLISLAPCATTVVIKCTATSDTARGKRKPWMHWELGFRCSNCLLLAC